MASGEYTGGKPPARVLVASPFAPGIETEDVVAWQAVARREVESCGDVALFAISAAVDKGATLPDFGILGVAVLIVERNAGPARAAAAGKIIERIRLTREASEARADIVWFLDIDICPPVGGWAALRDELKLGAGAALIPYPIDAPGSPPGLVVAGKNSRGDNVLAIVDSRTRPAEAGRTSFPVICGGMACVAIPMYTFLTVKFAVASLDAGVLSAAPELKKRILSGDALGWYMNALRAQVPIRAIAGAVCRVADGGGPSKS